MIDPEKKFQRFGKYLLLDHLVDGGMAEIYRARELAEDISQIVADKIIAIKVIRQQYSQDPSFKQMFLNEIKAAFGLVHPNISQTYNYGEFNKKLFTVLEYVHGKNLNQYLKVFKKNDIVFPVEIVVFIASQVCLGLDYAHKFTDKLTGQKLNLIHRDISPHNIMLDYDGQVKVIDFGIAKAETNTDETKAGTIKGKVAYLAPEYLQEEGKIDHRYDQFAVGLVMWELLTGKRVFEGNNEMAIVKKVYECKIPASSEFNPNVPKELEQILDIALDKNPNNRYEDMNQFSRALTKFLYSTFSDFNQSDVATFLKPIFQKEIDTQDSTLQGFGQIDLAPYCNDLKAENEGSLSSSDDLTNPEVDLAGNTRKTSEDGTGSSSIPGDTKKRIFGQTSLTNASDTKISPFIKKMRDTKK